MVDNYSPAVSEEVFAAWLDGTMSEEEETAFQIVCVSDADMQKILDANDQVDEDYEYMVEVGYDLPYEFKNDFDIPQIAIYDDEGELSPYDDVESYNQDDVDENEEQTCLEEDDVDNMNNSSLESFGMEELELI